MPSLFQLVSEDAKLIEEELDRLEAEGVPYAEAVERATAHVDSMTAEKAVNYAKVILSLEAFEERTKERAKAMLARGAARAATAQRLRQRMLELLPPDFTAEDEEVRVKFSKSKFVDTSRLTDVLALPVDVIRHIPEDWQIDKTAAMKHLKAGETLPGVTLGETLHVRIS
jgi:hypothetical protein